MASSTSSMERSVKLNVNVEGCQFQWLQSYIQRNMYVNPQHVEPLNLDANSFVSYSLKMQKNLVFTGGKESRTVGLD